MKRLVLNKKGMILFNLLPIITTAIAIYPSNNINTTIITKAIALILAIICIVLNRYTR